MLACDTAYVLHARPYRETSQLLTFFARHHGRFTAVGRAVRGARHGSSLRAFTPLRIAWRGKSELKSLVSVEPLQSLSPFAGDLLLVGLYLNELLMRLLHEHDGHEQLFDDYAQLLENLSGDTDVELQLRIFEYRLLQEIGYGLQLDQTADTGAAIQPQGWYRFVAGEGLIEVASEAAAPLYPGIVLLAFAAGDLSDPVVRRHAKRLMRQALQPLLGDKPLVSRELFMRQQNREADSA